MSSMTKEEEKEQLGQNAKSYSLPKKWNFIIILFNETFGTQITYDMFCAERSLKLKARSNVWEE